MKWNYGWMVVVLLIAGLSLSACVVGSSAAEVATGESGPIQVEHLEGNQPTRETLSEEAARRLDIQTASVGQTEIDGVQRMVIPYSAVLYDVDGATWVYTSPRPLTYVRYPVAVDDIRGDQAYLTDGPAPGSAVVTVGAEELFGAETEFKEE